MNLCATCDKAGVSCPIYSPGVAVDKCVEYSCEDCGEHHHPYSKCNSNRIININDR